MRGTYMNSLVTHANPVHTANINARLVSGSRCHGTQTGAPTLQNNPTTAEMNVTMAQIKRPTMMDTRKTKWQWIFSARKKKNEPSKSEQ